MSWSSFPAKHKKRCYQGFAAYALLGIVTAWWVSSHSQDTLRDWRGHTPSATAVVKTIYLTPQIEQAAKIPPPDIATGTATTTPHADAPPVADGKAYVALIVLDLGLSAADTEKAINDLPPRVALAFSPYADNVQDWIGKAAHLNHEALIQMPMETASYPQDDPGPRAISSRFSDKDNDDNLKWLLAQGKGTSGVINMMGSRFLTDQRRLSPVFDALRKNKSIFVETPDIKDSVGATVAGETKLPYLAADLQIDASVTDAMIRHQLASLEKIARERGYAVGIASPYPLTFNIIKSWAEDLQARGVTLAPLGTVWKNKPRHEEAAPPAPPEEQLRKP